MTTQIRFVEIVRAEGLISECDKPERFIGPDALARASRRLGEWARTAPAEGGYDKCDFKIEWADGETYAGRADIQRQHSIAGKYDLATHVRDFLTFIGGLWPAWRVREHFSHWRGPSLTEAEALARYRRAIAVHEAKPEDIKAFLAAHPL